MSVNIESEISWVKCDKCGREIGRDWYLKSIGELKFRAGGHGWYSSKSNDYCEECSKTEVVTEVVCSPVCERKPKLDPDNIIHPTKVQCAIRTLHNACDEIPAPRCWEAKGALLAMCMRIAALEDALKNL